MRHLTKTLSISLALCAASHTAQAADMSACEILLVQVMPAENVETEAPSILFRSAENFVNSVQDSLIGHITQVDGHNIQALMCERNDIIPTSSDYPFVATGIPFVLSQDFDSTDTDSLTLFWKDDKVEHVYKGYPISEEAQAILDTRLAGFTKRGLRKAPK